MRLLGFTTLHDSRRYAIPRCLGHLILSLLFYNLVSARFTSPPLYRRFPLVLCPSADTMVGPLPFMTLLAVGAAAVDLTFDRFAGEVARINHEREEEHRNNNNMAKAMLTKGVALANELNARGERRRMLQLREQELFAQWTTTQRKLELQAKGMMEELGESASFASDMRKSLDAAKSERSAQIARADEIDAQRHSLMDKRRDLLQARALIAANLEELTGNMTVLDAAKQKALQAAVQQADAVAQEETQLASLEHDSSKVRRRARLRTPLCNPLCIPKSHSAPPSPHRVAGALRAVESRRAPAHAAEPPQPDPHPGRSPEGCERAAACGQHQRDRVGGVPPQTRRRRRYSC